MTGRLAANLEQRLAEEAGAPVGSVTPIPEVGAATAERDPLAQLRDDMRSAAGRSLLVETTAAGFGTGPSSAPRGDWTPHRFGAVPPPELPILRDYSARPVLAACGVYPSMFEPNPAALREGWRLLHGTIAPLARLAAEELAEKLDVPALRLDLEGLFAGDIQGRARAFASLISGGMELERAARITGLE